MEHKVYAMKLLKVVGREQTYRVVGQLAHAVNNLQISRHPGSRQLKVLARSFVRHLKS